MKITEEYIESPSEQLEIVAANYIGDFVIRVFFKDGYNRIVDFKPFLESSLHPSIRKYLDEKKFRKYVIVDGNINWNDYDMIFPLEDLYKGSV